MVVCQITLIVIGFTLTKAPSLHRRLGPTSANLIDHTIFRNVIRDHFEPNTEIYTILNVRIKKINREFRIKKRPTAKLS